MNASLKHGKFKKAPADFLRIQSVPLETYQQLGAVEEGPLRALVYGWMLGGVVRHSANHIETPRGTVIVEPGQVWGSVPSMQEDILASVGENFPYHRIRYALKTMVRDGLIEDHGAVHPETKGTYGKRYSIDPPETNTYVDVVTAYRLYFYGDTKDFRLSELCVGDPREAGRSFRNRVGSGNPWIAKVAADGNDDPCFTNVGRWRSGQVRKADAPVFVPWLTADLDREDLMEAYDDARAAVELMDENGVDLERTFVSFSGRRGFHIQISADQLGSPIWKNSESAKVATKEFFERIMPDIDIDPCTLDPRNLLRLSGSKHEKTGQFKQTWRADEFLSTRPETVFAELREVRSFAFPDPTVGAIEDELLATFEDAANAAGVELAKAHQFRPRSGKGREGKMIKRIREGIEESDNWSEYHTGRNKAGYILACWLIEHPEYQKEDAAWAELQRWNQLNSPPMDERELKRIFANADKTINGPSRGR